MKHIIPFIIIVTLLCLSCGGSGKNVSPSRTELKRYANEYFAIDYPSDWITSVHINNMCDTIPDASIGIELTLSPRTLHNSYHALRVQKSAMFYVFDTPEQWRDLSIEFKQNDNKYLGYIEPFIQDSLNFNGYPAAMTGFVKLSEYGDTIVQKQLVVMVDSTIYYLDNVFDWNDDGSLEDLGDSILSTTKFFPTK